MGDHGCSACRGPARLYAFCTTIVSVPRELVMADDLLMRARIAAGVALLMLGLAAGDALAQRPPYRDRPDGYERGYDRDDDRRGRRGREHEAGVFDYYLLALSWSPTFCADVGDRRRDPQCSPRGRPFAFVLHGLWPQYERGWPQDCESPDRGF